MTLSEFTLHLDKLGITYKSDSFENSVFIVIADRFGYRFGGKGELTRGFIWPPFEDLDAEWEEWRLYLRRTV